MEPGNEISGFSEELQQKHRKERKELQAQIQQLKHAVPKGDKKRKREMTSQVAQLEAQLSEKHGTELQQWTEQHKVSQLTDRLSAASVTDTDQVNGVTDAGDQCQGETRQNKPSKAQRRREKKAQAEREREERIRVEMEENLLGPRNVEAVKLKTALKKRDLSIFEIPSDGNCLYSAIVHQLHRQDIETSVGSLRKQVADHMRSQSDDFLPFLTRPNSNDPYTPEQFAEYCSRLETTTEWGGQLEIRALANVLRQPVEVIQADGPSIVVGDEHQGESLLLSYHRYAYGLGEHYNSVVPKAETNSENEEDGFN